MKVENVLYKFEMFNATFWYAMHNEVGKTEEFYFAGVTVFFFNIMYALCYFLLMDITVCNYMYMYVWAVLVVIEICMTG